MEKSRRNFIKVSALGVGGAMALGSSWSMVNAAAFDSNQAEEVLNIKLPNVKSGLMKMKALRDNGFLERLKQ